MISPALEEMARRRAGMLKLVKVNVDDHPDVSARFAVQGIPTLLLFDRGDLVDRAVGARGLDALEAWVDGALARAR
jgi:thioredoxin-like negative regulator of GroEL